MNAYLDMELLRFTTAGSVDDGKSTLIGRLLFDTKSIFEDQLDQVKRSSDRKGLAQADLSLLTDGLKDEREQGITIDVAYRYFATPKRKFIIADTPGHIQYTRKHDYWRIYCQLRFGSHRCPPWGRRANLSTCHHRLFASNSTSDRLYK